MVNRRVAILGANGNLGASILKALLGTKTFEVTVLSRVSSQSIYPDSVRVVRVSDDFPYHEIVTAFQGVDAVVVVCAGSNSELQIRLADAAVDAGVDTLIPPDFGSCDSNSPRALELVPLYRHKKAVREHLQRLSEHTRLSWTSIVCGHFFDYGLRSGLLQFDLKKRQATIFDGGNTKWSSTTLETVASAVVSVLRKPQETKNRVLFIQSFQVTQNEIRACLEQETAQRWQVNHANHEEYIQRVRTKVEEGGDIAEAMEDLVSVVGIIDADWEAKEGFANSLLNLKQEHLDDVISRVL
ncbi:MAG: hypothetical protein M1828_006269 [Chrysothrix sp. TS-e1954]|nr:MAG: hypothetical protein M1828_006269 [Chrysothrix sp. TS-e1954]